MAQAESNDNPSAPATQDAPSSLREPPALPVAEAAIMINSAPQLPDILPNLNSVGGADDEVQFIFSAPRRRKKKRRRMESTHFSTEGIKCFNPTPECTKTGTPSQRHRRGTTGMVARLESCHIGDIKGNPTDATRSGSLPSITPIAKVYSQLRPTPSTQANAKMPPLKVSPLVPFMSMPRPNNPHTGPLNTSKAWSAWAGMQPAANSSRKRNHEGEDEKPTPHPNKRTQIELHSTQAANPSWKDEIQLRPLDVAENCHRTSIANKSNVLLPISPTHISFRNAVSNLDPNYRSPSTQSTTNLRGPAMLEQNVRVPPQNSSQFLASVSPSSNGNLQKQTITVPARLVPEKSVSPRTQTIEIPRPSFPNPTQARQMMLFQRAVNSPARRNLENPENYMLPMDRNNQFHIPRPVPQAGLPLQGFHRAEQNTQHYRPQNSHTSLSDVQRRPSLYKVPPWPSPASSNATSIHGMSSVLRSPMTNMSMGSSDIGISNALAGRKIFSNNYFNNLANGEGPGMRGKDSVPSYKMMPVTPPRTPFSQRLSQSTSPSLLPPSTPAPIIPNKRKYSPDLIVDIAETCQENFPFAAVAERHQVPTQRVFDTFSAIIQLPLLRSASDDRRHGSLGKRRMSEFKDAKKAMEMAMKDKDGDDKDGGEVGRRRKNAKKGPPQPLLKAAILNRASSGKESGS